MPYCTSMRTYKQQHTWLAWWHNNELAACVQGSNEMYKVDMPAARLALLADRSATPRGQSAPPPRHGALLHRDMLLLAWGPAVQAAEALLEAAHPGDVRTVDDAMRLMRAVRACPWIRGCVQPPLMRSASTVPQCLS